MLAGGGLYRVLDKVITCGIERTLIRVLQGGRG